MIIINFNLWNDYYYNISINITDTDGGTHTLDVYNSILNFFIWIIPFLFCITEFTFTLNLVLLF